MTDVHKNINGFFSVTVPTLPPPPPPPQYADYSQLERRNSREGESSGDVVIKQLTLEDYGGTIRKTRAVASVTSVKGQ
jgi:hypothetical protein